MAPNLRLRACLAMCLNYPRSEPEVAFKTLAYKKKKCTQLIIYLRLPFFSEQDDDDDDADDHNL